MASNLQMVDLVSQYQRLRPEIDAAIHEVLESGRFINGPVVERFSQSLADFLDVKYVIPCANGTDALQIAFMALGLKQGDEVIVPAFTYVATAEVIALLGLKPVMVDVDPNTFNIDLDSAKVAISKRTKAIVPVHLFGQSANMEAIMNLAKAHNLYVVEDAAQSIGAKFRFSDGLEQTTGTMGHIGTTSFFPSKNLGCFGDGGAIFTNDEKLAGKLQMIANHGQEKKYYHKVVGVNSRLDAIQAAVLNVKLKHLEDFTASRLRAADWYDKAFSTLEFLELPFRDNKSTHVFHQYTLRVKTGARDELKEHLASLGIPSMIYYPVPLYRQEAFKNYCKAGFQLPVTEELCREVLSLPMHPELDKPAVDHISTQVHNFFVKEKIY